MIKREPAWRILSGELNLAKLMLKSTNSRDPSYALTPLGAMINRVFIVGEAIGKDDFGDDNRTFFRIKLSDPTGIFYLSVGQYQPAALNFIQSLEMPSHIAVVGKVKSFEPDGGGLYLSIRPEFIYPATPTLRDRWLLKTVQSLSARYEAVSEAQKMSDPTVDQLKALGYSTQVAEGALKALEHYGKISLEPFQILLKDTLQFLTNGNGKGNTDLTLDHSSQNQGVNQAEIEASELSSTKSSTSESDNENKTMNKEKEKQILKILDNKPGSRKHGLNWNELLLEVSKQGMSKQEAEVIVRDLMERGIVYEPIIGVLKKIQ
ncbi:MAG: hypothetical protein JSV49_09835 [Thermoplasmata archaeon]|nr:MAG: hypothetical protein JSV49_09835 [Thermoplasmata archaeon]